MESACKGKDSRAAGMDERDLDSVLYGFGALLFQAHRRSGVAETPPERRRCTRLRSRLGDRIPREFELLTVFVAHPRQVLSRDQIFERVWGSWGDRSAGAVYVRRLREKLGEEILTTVWGVGYRFDP